MWKPLFSFLFDSVAGSSFSKVITLARKQYELETPLSNLSAPTMAWSLKYPRVFSSITCDHMITGPLVSYQLLRRL